MIDLQRKLCAEHSKGEERTTSVVRVEACRCRRSGTCRTFGSLIRIYRAGHRVLAAVAGGVRAEGLEPSRGYPQRIFVPSTAFAAPPRAFVGLASLRSGLSLHHAQIRLGLGAARLVSTPSRRGCRRRAWLGIAITGFPEFGQFCIAGFPASTQVLTQVRCVCHSATPAWLALLYNAARGSRNPMELLSPVCLPVPPPRLYGRLSTYVRCAPSDTATATKLLPLPKTASATAAMVPCVLRVLNQCA